MKGRGLGPGIGLIGMLLLDRFFHVNRRRIRIAMDARKTGANAERAADSRVILEREKRTLSRFAATEGWPTYLSNLLWNGHVSVHKSPFWRTEDCIEVAVARPHISRNTLLSPSFTHPRTPFGVRVGATNQQTQTTRCTESARICHWIK
jgi:hypothetical protein